MPLYDGMQHGRGFNPFIQLPEYGPVIEPGGLATYAALEQAKASNTTSKKSSSESGADDGSNYVMGMKGEQDQQRMMYTAIDQQLNLLQQKAAEDYAKYGSVERWRNSDEGKDFFRKANYLQAQRQNVSNNNHVLNYNQKLFKQKEEKVVNNGLDGLYFLRKDGKGFIPQFGGNNGIMTNGEYLEAVYNSPNYGVNEKSTQMTTRNFSEVKDDDYKGHFDVFARGWFADAQESMQKGGPGFKTVNEQGQVKQGINPGDAVAYLLKTQYSSNYKAVNNVANYLYDALDENARYDLAQQFYQDIIGGNSDAINILRTNKQTAPLLDQIENSIKSGVPVPAEEGKPYAWSRGNIEALLSQYGAIRISQMANTYVKTDVDASMGGKVWDIGGDKTGQVPITAEQAINSPKVLLERGQPMPAGFFEANADGGKTYNNIVRDINGNPLREWRMTWDDKMIEAGNGQFKPRENEDGTLTYVSAKDHPLTKQGYVTQNGVTMLPKDGTVLVGVGGESIYGPAFLHSATTGNLTNVSNSNSKGDFKYTVYYTLLAWSPKDDGKTTVMVPAKDQNVGGSKFVPVEEDIEDLDEGSLEINGFREGELNGQKGYFHTIRVEAEQQFAYPGKDAPSENTTRLATGGGGQAGQTWTNYKNRF